MDPQPLAIGVFSRSTTGYYLGAMLSGVHQVTRAAGVPLLVIQSELEDMRLPPFGADHVAGWIVLSPIGDDAANLTALMATGVPVVAVATVPEGVACASVVIDNRGETCALVSHLIDHGHRQIAYIDQEQATWSRQRYLGYQDALRIHGIPLDLTLVIDATHIRVNEGMYGPLHLEQRGVYAARALIARGMPCTALVASTDHSAIAAMQVLQAAGYRVPEDVAVVGFDDTADAQYAQPPLTTVRTPFDALGQAAAEYMLAVLNGERDAQPIQIFSPSSVLCRRSCGCPGVAEILSHGVTAIVAAPDWQGALAERLVALATYPLAPDPGTPPDQIWPGVGTLIAAVESVLEGQDSAMLASEMEQAWKQAVAITENQDLLNAAVALVEDVAERRLAAVPHTARTHNSALFRQLREAMLRARLAYEAAKNQSLTMSDMIKQNLSMTLLSSQAGESQSLAWLGQTPATWGCLALWDAPTDTPATLAVAGVYQPGSAPQLAIGDHYPAAALPPLAALPLPARQGHDLTILCPLKGGADDLGVLAVCGFADQNFSIGYTDTLWVQAVLLAATLKRDALITRLEDQAIELAKARDTAEATNVELAKARDAAQAANRAKSAFLAQMSHELRTPLNGILGYAQVLGRQQWDAATATGLNIIQQSGEHLLTLINDILDLAKIEAGRQELNPTVITLPTFLDDIVDIIRARAQDKQLALLFDPSPDLPRWVEADETRLRQVLLNLLGNALKFTDQGTITLRVTITDHRLPTTEDRGLKIEDSNVSADDTLSSILNPQSSTKLPVIRFEISDTGSGIAPDHQEKIFLAFEQVGELSRRAEGTGLGLAISRQLVRAMGGELHVKSVLGLGSTFWFTVVLPVVEAVVPAASGPERPIAGYAGVRRTVLVVDDVASNRAVLTAMLALLGFTVHVAQHGQQAVELAQQLRPDLILMDRWMPILSGLEAVSQIRQIAALREVPIIATSASVSPADQAAIGAAGYDDFLAKPITWERLIALLGQYLQLEWIYTADQAEAEPVGAAEAEAPPGEELAALFELAQLGDVFAVQARAAQLEQRDPRWQGFAQRLEQLAGQCEQEQILALLARYLPPNPHM